MEDNGLAIGQREILEAVQTLKTYKDGKSSLENRIVRDEEWWKLRHWEQMRHDPREEIRPASAWLFNTLLNKHADAMDNFPEPSVLPREAGDQQAARQLSAVLPVVLENNGYEQTYSDMWWYKLKTGTGVQGVFWDPAAADGLGDVAVRRVDLLELFWEPGVTDIQRSANLFHVTMMDRDAVEAQWPGVQLKGRGAAVELARYRFDDQVDTGGKAAVVDWYYHREAEGRQVLHLCKFVEDQLLFASENMPEYVLRGFYDHGQYPFVLDPMFPVEGSPAGFGYIDVLKDCQETIDRLDQVLVRNALMSGRKRFFIRQDGSVSEKEFADWNSDFVHVAGSLSDEAIREITVAPLGSSTAALMQAKIEELKETAGVREFSQGGTQGGVTAASAIAALQEAGSKLSRDMIKSAYRAFSGVCTLAIELIRQFYDAPRCFRIMGAEGVDFVRFDNSLMQPRPLEEEYGLAMGTAMPVYDVKIRSYRQSPFNRIAQNELAKELYSLGLLNPGMSDQALACVDMMDFEGKDILMARLAENGGLAQQTSALQQQVTELEQMVGELMRERDAGQIPEQEPSADSIEIREQ